MRRFLKAAALLLASAGVLWFARGALVYPVRLACEQGGASLDRYSDARTWSCREACAMGSAKHCILHGDLALRRGVGVDPRADAAEVAQRACEKGGGAACLEIGEIYASSDSHADVQAHATEAFDRGCTLGNARSCVELGRFLAVLQEDRGGARRLALFRRACEGGDGTGCAALADVYLRGDGTPPNVARGLELSQLACEKDDASSCLQMAVTYAAGILIAKDRSRAVADYLRACELGRESACVDLGRLYVNDPAMPRDDKRVEATFAASCAANPGSEACVRFGEMLAYGRGVPVDTARAQNVLEGACRRGATHGCSRAGKLLLSADHARALVFYELGCLAHPTEAFAPSLACAARNAIHDGVGIQPVVDALDPDPP